MNMSKNECFCMEIKKTSTLTSNIHKNRAKALVYNLISCLTSEQYAKLTDKSADFTNSLLHTQSKDYPPSKDYKLFYTAILENKVSRAQIVI